MDVITVVNMKGGVGKTTLAVQLGAALSRRHRVLVVDADRQGSTGWWTDRAPAPLPFDVASSQSLLLLGRLRELEERYDRILIDTPGGADSGALIETVLDVTNFAIVPLTPDPLAVPATLRTIGQLLEPRAFRYSVALNRIDMCVPTQLERWCGLLDAGYGLPRFASVVRQYRSQADTPVVGGLVTTLPDNRRTRGTIADIVQLGFELDEQLAPAMTGRW